jgi:signal transduction histidine kinase/CheY-like chemotaxis protein
MESEVYSRAQEVAEANRQLRAANEDLARLYDQIAQLMTQADAEFGRASIPPSPITPEDMLARVGRMIADHKRLDEQFRQAQKMEAVGQLAGGVAHDFNNLLTVIVGYANLVQNCLSPENELRRKVAEIQRAGEKAALLTGQLLAFSRKQPRQQHVLDLNAIVDDMQDILRRLIAEDIDLRFRLDPAGCPVSADGNHLTQVLMNLVVNARDAMPIGGKLTIATRTVSRDSEYSDGDGVRPPGSYAVLSVADTGVGMDEETSSRIFEPFFSTKGVGKGTGLGLATVYGIVVQHGGWIEVESAPGRGATFRIYLPAASGTPTREVESARTVRSGRQATILLVEDQAAVRLFAEDVLAEAGHKVLTAGNGLAALEVAASHKNGIDLLITDVVMPEMNGPELAARLTSVHPDLNVLYVSGYTGSVLMDRGIIPDDIILLRKPFLPESLVNKVDELLQKR